MSTARLIKLAPTLILFGYLGYAVFTLQPAPVDAVQAERALEKTVIELLAEGAEVTDALKGRVRDPFSASPPAADAPAGPAKEVVQQPVNDPIADLVRGMSLDATFLQGRDQLAIIDGRIYSRGQILTVPVGGDDPPRELRVLTVTKNGVILRSNGKHYTLGYPTELGKKKETDGKPGPESDPTVAEIEGAGQAEIFQELLNSPLGAIGRSILGQVGKPPGPAIGKAGAAKNRGAKRSSSGR